jgi:hypothetical protein
LPQALFDGFGNTVYVEAWVYLTQLTSPPYRNTVFIKRADFNDLVLSIRWDGTPRCSLDIAVADDAGTVPLNVWTKLACWYDGTTMRAYVNGNLVSSGVQPLAVDWFRNYFQTEIGNNTHDAPQPHGFHGVIDEVIVAKMPPCVFAPVGQPITRTRDTGPPAWQDIAWTSCGGSGTLTLATGSTSSALVYLNGALLLGPADFPLPGGATELPINLLAGTNTLAIQLRGEPGSTVTISFRENTYSISGNAGLASAMVSVGGSTITSDSSGNYVIDGLPQGAYEVTPFASGCSFSPSTLSVVLPPSASAENFSATCAGSADVVVDPQTGLTWTKSDNGSDIDWATATSYCQSLLLGGFNDWRLASISELAALYDPNVSAPCASWLCHARLGIALTGPNVWSATIRDPAAVYIMDFIYGGLNGNSPTNPVQVRALCVRP